MKSLNELIEKDLNRLGIKKTKKEKCATCNYGTMITIEKDDGEKISNCKYCNDKKLATEIGLPRSKEESDRMKMQRKANSFTVIPSKLKDATLNSYKGDTDTQKEAGNQAIKFITEFDKEKSLVLSGLPGIGKSHLAVAIAKALKKDYSVLFLTTNDILKLIQASYGNSVHSEDEIIDLCSDVDLLVLDDLGAEYSKPTDSESWAGTIIFSILDKRLGKSVIVSTNYSESQIVEKFGMNGQRIVSRMNDGADLIRMTGNDGRRK